MRDARLHLREGDGSCRFKPTVPAVANCLCNVLLVSCICHPLHTCAQSACVSATHSTRVPSLHATYVCGSRSCAVRGQAMTHLRLCSSRACAWTRRKASGQNRFMHGARPNDNVFSLFSIIILYAVRCCLCLQTGRRSRSALALPKCWCARAPQTT